MYNPLNHVWVFMFSFNKYFNSGSFNKILISVMTRLPMNRHLGKSQRKFLGKLFMLYEDL